MGLSQKLFVIFFVLLVLMPYYYRGYREIGYGVTLMVTPLQAATKITAGMAEWQKEWQNWWNGRNTIYGTHRR